MTHAFRLTTFCFVLLLAAIAANAETRVVIETGLGPIEVTLDEQRAPRTVANFLRYVDAGRYQGGRFHRTVRTKPDNQPRSNVKIDVIQGGINPRFQKQDFPPVALERTNATGIRHEDGVISMARAGVDSATSDFFICVGDQPSLDFGGIRNPDLQGFAAFGRVTKGMEIVRRIHEAPAGPSSGSGVVAGNQALAPPIAILSIRRQ